MLQKSESNTNQHPVVANISEKINTLSKKIVSITASNEFFENERNKMNANLNSYQIFTASQRFSMWISKRHFITKIVGGLLIVAPLIAGGVLGHLVYLIVGGLIFSALYLPVIMFVDSLGAKISQSKEIHSMLKGLTDIYYTSIKHLKEIEIEFEACIDDLHNALENLNNENKEFKTQNGQLSISNEEYKTLNTKLSVKIEALNSTIQCLSENLDLSAEQKCEFLKKINDVLTEKGASFDKIFDRFGKAERDRDVERQMFVQRFESLNMKYEALCNLFKENMQVFTTDIRLLNASINDIQETKLLLTSELENLSKLLETNKSDLKGGEKLILALQTREKTLSQIVSQKDQELVKTTKILKTLEKRVQDVSEGTQDCQENGKSAATINGATASSKVTFFANHLMHVLKLKNFLSIF